MTTKHLTVVYPSWQGTPRAMNTWYSGKSIGHYSLKGDHKEIAVDLTPELPVSHGIWGYDQITSQMAALKDLLQNEAPDTLFTVGGGDDMDILPVDYLNQKEQGKLTVVLFTAYANLLTPEQSEDHAFASMSLRTLAAPSDTGMEQLVHGIDPGQVILVGTRDFNDDEEAFMKDKGIKRFRAYDINQKPGLLMEELKRREAGSIYVGVNINAIDASVFSFQARPAAGGLQIGTLIQMLDALTENCQVAGMSFGGCTELPSNHLGLVDYIVEKGEALADK
jgi:arginase